MLVMFFSINNCKTCFNLFDKNHLLCNLISSLFFSFVKLFEINVFKHVKVTRYTITNNIFLQIFVKIEDKTRKNPKNLAMYTQLCNT